MSSAVENAYYVVAAEPMPGYKLKVTLRDAQEWLLDLENLIHSRDAFWRLRQERYFRMVRPDLHGVLTWPEGEDLAPESLLKYRVIKVEPGDEL